MENKMKNSELDKVSGGDRIEQAEDGKWMIYPYRKRFSTEKEAEEYVNSIINARAQKNYELEKKLLDDTRFSYCWLRSHTITKPQGRIRLLSELSSRGIQREDAKKALDLFFEENEEIQLCRRAMEKAVRSGKKDEKLIKYMIDSGFSYKMICSLQNETTE